MDRTGKKTDVPSTSGASNKRKKIDDVDKNLEVAQRLDKSSTKKRSKGGAEKLRGKKQTELKALAAKNKRLDQMFQSANNTDVPTSSQKDKSVDNSAALQTDKSVDNSATSQTDKSVDDSATSQTDKSVDDSATSQTDKSVDNGYEGRTSSSFLSKDFFERPNKNDLDTFLNVHPCQPRFLKNNVGKKFDTHSLFYRNEDDVNRMWLSYCNDTNTLHCSLCLAFGGVDNTSPFISPGVGNWDRSYLLQRIDVHETSKSHQRAISDFFAKDKKCDIVSLLFRSHKSKHNDKVSFYRKVLEREIDILKLIGKRGLSYRSHRNEDSGALQNENVDHGNFLELFILLAKYDPVCREHLQNVDNKKTKGVKGRGSHLTLLSKTTLNNVLDIIGKLMKRRMGEEMQTAKMIGVEIDTTQDVSVDDQCSIIIRYVTDKVHERLIAMRKCISTTGKAMYDLIEATLKESGLEMCDIVGTSTDGASNMQGQYNGFTKHVSDASPLQVFVWCYAHVLNLVIQDTTNTVDASNLFSLLNLTASFLRDSHKRMDEWKRLCPNDRRLGLIGATRWWAKNDAVTKVFGAYNDPKNALFPQLIKTLDNLKQKCTGEAKLKATTYKEKFESYEMIAIAQVFLKIFSITSPLSKYLQTSGIDLLKAQSMVMRSLGQLRDISRDYDDVKANTNTFVKWANNELEPEELDCVEETFKVPRVRKRKLQPGETAEDTVFDPEEKFRIFVHNKAFDDVTSGIESRFQKHGKLFSGLSFLDPKNFEDVKKLGKNLGESRFEKLSNSVIRFNPLATPANIKAELVDFANKWDALKDNLTDTYDIQLPVQDDVDLDEDHLKEAIVERNESGNNIVHLKTCKDCVVCCYWYLRRYNLYSRAYSSLFTCYKYLLTLPVSEVACERSFSKLGFIKNKLRNSLSQDRLEIFMLMSMEPDILNAISCHDIIDELSKHSTLLNRTLTYM